MLFYDFEVFKYDWLVVLIDMAAHEMKVIENDPDELMKYYEDHVKDIWGGFNSVRYDQYILKGILCGFDPKKINDFIIVGNQPGYKYSSQFRKIPLNNYDVMQNLDRGLKTFEGFMGNDIKESSVPFDIDRKLTRKELDETIQYCIHDVEQTIEVFLKRTDDFEAHLGLVKLICGDGGLDLSLLGKTKAQLSATLLGARRQSWDDEFDIDFPDTMRIEKYTQVIDWFKDPKNRSYYFIDDKGKAHERSLELDIAGVPHKVAWGGIHGALKQYHGEGYFLNMDVASLYPSLMIRYNLHSRNIPDPKKYEEVYHTRLKYKAEKNPLQLPLKLVLNGTYGAMKDVNNALYDPRQANRVCIYGQLLLIDLMEKLEGHCQIIQSNTDGVLIKLPDGSDSAYELIDDICYEWEKRTGLKLEFDEYKKVFQKDVNNYIIVDAEGHAKAKGGYVKKLTDLDYDLPIVNKALNAYMVNGILPEQTINSCNELKEFQMVTKISSKYSEIRHGAEYEYMKDSDGNKKLHWIKEGKRLKEKCIRIFASRNDEGGVIKLSVRTGNPERISNSPDNCFIYNDDVNGVKVDSRLDKDWYIDLTYKRLQDFGVM